MRSLGPAARHSPAAERNAAPILAQLQRLLPLKGVALEVASGTGQHAAHFAAGLPGWSWFPSDPDPGAVASIAEWCAGLDRVQPPVLLDVLHAHWTGFPDTVDAIFCANMLHIAPWQTCAALMSGARRHLESHGLLIVYGPFWVNGEAMAPSNLSFDADLRQRDPTWGLRRLSDVESAARACGLGLVERVAMPANNQLLVFARQDSGKMRLS